jgi:hypothetical protein
LKHRISKLEQKIKSYGVREPVTFVMPFSPSGSKRCGFWQGQALMDYYADNPGPALSLGCPLIPKENWCDLGSSTTISDCNENAARCAVCKHLIKGDDNHVR